MAEEFIELDKNCPSCGANYWSVSDRIEYYIEICKKCGHIDQIKKQDFIDEFQCPDCGCLEATLEENKKLIATRCKHCGKQTIVLEKQTTDDARTRMLEKQRIQREFPNANLPKCPKCGSTSITTGQKGFTLLTGFLGSNKTVNRCSKCGHSWKPKLW